MDVDGGSLNSDQNELEQSLLEGFSRMGTRDRDDLINQMLKLLGPDLSYTSASFFLDMNNWNLQNAVCSYFDHIPTIRTPPDIQPNPDTSRRIPIPLPMPIFPPPSPSVPGDNLQMTLISSSSLKEQVTEYYEPSTNIEWKFLVMNPGVTFWPEGCILLSEDSSIPVARVPIITLSYDVVCIKFNITTPATVGMHSKLYRLCTPQGVPFGDELWMRLKVQYPTNGMQVMDEEVLDEKM